MAMGDRPATAEVVARKRGITDIDAKMLSDDGTAVSPVMASRSSDTVNIQLSPDVAPTVDPGRPARGALVQMLLEQAYRSVPDIQ